MQIVHFFGLYIVQFVSSIESDNEGDFHVHHISRLAVCRRWPKLHGLQFRRIAQTSGELQQVFAMLKWL
jgi:hypothetical protein